MIRVASQLAPLLALLLALLLIGAGCSQPGSSAAAEAESASDAGAAAASAALPLAEPARPPLAPEVEDGPARARLLAPGAALVAGQTTSLGLRLELEPGWHLYWRGQNDTGLPLAFEARLPEGWSLGEPGWPAPERLVGVGPSVDHVYHDAVTLLLPVRVPAEARGPAHLELAADWLVCQEVCLPGAASLTLDIEVVAPAHAVPTREADRALLEAARAALPQALPADVRLEREGELLLLRVPGARRLEFHPDMDGLPLAEIAERCAAEGELLRLAVDPRLPGGARLQGVLSVQRDGALAPDHHHVDLAPPGA